MCLHMNNHLISRYDSHYLSFSSGWGEIGNACFLFMSGYGIYSSMKNMEYVKFSYIKKKIIRIIITFLFAFTSAIVICSFVGTPYDYSLFFEQLFTMTIPFTREWFLKAIIYCYIISFISFRMTKATNYRLFSVFVFLCLYFVVAHYCKIGSWMYSSILCYGLGMLFAEYKEHFAKVPNSLALIVLVTIILLLRYRIDIPLEVTFSDFVSCILLAYISRIVKLNLFFIEYVGKNSLLFYAFHIGYVHFCFGKYIDPFVNIGITTMLVFMYSHIQNKSMNKIKI